MIHIHWTGRGWMVFFVPLGLLPVVSVALYLLYPAADVSAGPGKFMHQVFGIWLLLSALCVYAIDRRCEAVARAQQGGKRGLFHRKAVRDDSFLFLVMWAWPYVLAALGLGVLGYSLWL